MIPISDNPGPRRSIPWVTWGIIAVNIAIFIYQVSLGQYADYFVFAYSVVPVALVQGIPQTQLISETLPFQTPVPVYLTLITSMFLHGGWLHIGGNMLFLFVFGDNVEDRMGHIPYLVFYLFCGIIASAAQIIVNPASQVPNIGASGAIAGVLAAYLVLFPWAKVNSVVFIFVFFTFVRLPALILIGLWFLLQFFNGFLSLPEVNQNTGGVAYFAHIGGFVAGLAITFLLRNKLTQNEPVSYPYFPRHPNSMDPMKQRNW